MTATPLLYMLLLSIMPWVSIFAATPQKVVSTNLCTDQLLLLIARPEQIASVSLLGADTDLSFMWKKARIYPTNDAGSEQLIDIDPDLVLVSPYTSHMKIERLLENGVRVETLPSARNLKDIEHNIRLVADWVGEDARGMELISDLQKRLKQSSTNNHKVLPSKPPGAIFLQPNGYTSGKYTLQDTALKLSGWRNLASEAGIEGYRHIDLEQLITLNPDIIFTSTQLGKNNALALRVLNHPALRTLHGDQPPREIDYRYWICGGPMLADAVELLTQYHQSDFSPATAKAALHP